MAIQPIDLQVLFARLNQIGREQSAHREMVSQTQAVAANEIAERSEEQDRKVGQLRTDEEGPEKTNEDGEGSAQSSEQGTRREDHEAADGQEVISDPDLGQNIDISG
jgi:hypothetical protein